MTYIYMKYITQLHRLILITVRKTRRLLFFWEYMICEFLKTSLPPTTDDCPKLLNYLFSKWHFIIFWQSHEWMSALYLEYYCGKLYWKYKKIVSVYLIWKLLWWIWILGHFRYVLLHTVCLSVNDDASWLEPGVLEI